MTLFLGFNLVQLGAILLENQRLHLTIDTVLDYYECFVPLEWKLLYTRCT